MWNSSSARGLLLSTVVVCTSSVAEQAQRASIVGNAYDRDTGNFLYSEHHFCGDDRLLCTVEYRDSAGSVFAKKDLDYRQNMTGPSLVMTDYRRDIEVRVAASEQKSLVIDAGFDNFVRTIWDDLDGGDKVEFPFLPAGFDEPVRMKALRSEGVDCNDGDLCLLINLDSWILSLLVDPIELSYSRSDRRLMRFSGISNIKGVNGEALDVDILYRYVDTPLPAGPQGSHKLAQSGF